MKKIPEIDFASWLVEVKKEIANNSDRGVAILICSILDEQLRRLLLSFLIDSSQVKDLFSVNAPFASFNNKINSCFALGLISKTDYKNLHILRDIRNKFAHKFESISFEEISIKQKASNFSIPEESYVPFHFRMDEFSQLTYKDFQPLRDELTIREKYFNVFSHTAMVIYERERFIEPRNEFIDERKAWERVRSLTKFDQTKMEEMVNNMGMKLDARIVELQGRLEKYQGKVEYEEIKKQTEDLLERLLSSKKELETEIPSKLEYIKNGIAEFNEVADAIEQIYKNKS